MKATRRVRKNVGRKGSKKRSENRPVVSIITVCLNAEKTIERTLESVRHQSYPAIEHIIVDGRSTDATLEIVQRYRRRFSKIISEFDAGISDAFNKGIANATGDFVQILNGDDWLDESAVAEAVAALQAHPMAAFVFGDLLTIEGHEVAMENMPGDPDYARKLKYTMPRLNHPTMVVRKAMFEKYGTFDVKYKIAMDYDWIMRLQQGGELGYYSPRIRAFKPKGGVSDKKRFDAFRECREISIRYGLQPALAYSYFLLRCIKHEILVLIGAR